MDGPLVDAEQFPRTDIDLYTVRQARHRIICKFVCVYVCVCVCVCIKIGFDKTGIIGSVCYLSGYLSWFIPHKSSWIL